MMEPGLYSWKNPWLKNSVLFVCGTVLVSLAIGFLWLPSLQGDFSVQGVWSTICRAAGVPGRWGDPAASPTTGARTTAVVLNRDMGRTGGSDAIGRGATLALQCTVCHGARGLTATDAPNLAGQYPEVIIKELADFKRGDRISTIMQAFAGRLTDDDVRELAAYYASLPRVTMAEGVAAPALVRVGDPMRNIAPCGACHGRIDHKLGAPWLDGLPGAYLSVQLTAFAAGARHNDSHSQMRNMARNLSTGEIDALAAFYGRAAVQ